VRYLVASDLHYGLEQLDWIAARAAAYDAVVLGGDHLDVVGRVELNAQIALISAYLARLADRTTVVASSGNHDLTSRRADGEKAATWMRQLDPRVWTDGRSLALGDDLVSVCAWWEGPSTLAELEAQLDGDAGRSTAGVWVWAYHSPPDRSPTSWSGSRHYGDDVLNRLIDSYRPDIVLTGHVHEAPFRPDGSWYDRIGDTVVLNAGRRAGPVPAHLVIDTATREIAWWASDDPVTLTF
jgi:Icc-related predicted phosphoesterase